MYGGKYPPNGQGPPPRYPTSNVYMNQKQAYNQPHNRSPQPSHVSPNRVARPPHQIRSSPGTNRSPYRGAYTGPGGARSSPPPRGPGGIPTSGGRSRSRRNSDQEDRGGNRYNMTRRSSRGEKDRQEADNEKAFEAKIDLDVSDSFFRTASAKPLEPKIANLTLLYDPPVEGCDLKPYASLTGTNGITVAVKGGKNEERVSDFRWFRGQRRLCSHNNCHKAASLQCLDCLKSKQPLHIGFFCSNECLRSAWANHKKLHAAVPAIKWNELEPDDDGQEVSDQDLDSDDEITIHRKSRRTIGASLGELACKYPPPISNLWAEVSQFRTYVPAPEDVGRALRVECAPILRDLGDGDMVQSIGGLDKVLVDKKAREVRQARNGGQKFIVGKWRRLETNAVLAAPGVPPPRHRVYKPPRLQEHNVANHPFKTLTYNVLADRYASRQLYPYAELWALCWSYRKNRLLREILNYQADIVCLQEVQTNHFENFFQPQMSKAGYEGLFKSKTRLENNDGPSVVDGCAIFYKRDRFALMEQYGIEYNEAVRQQTQDPDVQRRLMRGNIALVAVLEEIGGGQTNRRQRKVCVANTHIYWDPDYADVKLWQAWVLCQELEKLVIHRNLPLVLCGDFNSMTDSAVYELLSTAGVRADHRVFDHDPCNILPSPEQITHRLPLFSAYASIGEPKYTNFTGHFVGILDYIWYSKTHITSTSCLDVDPEPLLTQHTALPSPLYPSDHLALVGECDWIEP